MEIHSTKLQITVQKRRLFPFAKIVEKTMGNSLVPFLSPDKKTYSYLISLSQSLAKFAGIIAIVSLFFSILQLWLDSSYSINKTEGTILQIESSIDRIESIVKTFKLSGISDIVVITVLIALTGSLPILSKYKLIVKYKKAMKVLGTAVMVLTIFSSFTFFGIKLKEHESGYLGELQSHKLQIIKENKLLLHDVSEIIIDEVVSQYVEKDLDGLTHEVDMLNFKGENPISLQYEDTLYNLNTIEQLKPLITEKIKKLASELPMTFHYSYSGEKEINKLTAYINNHPNEVRDFAIRSGTSENANLGARSSLAAEVDESIDAQLYTDVEKLKGENNIFKNISLGDIQGIRSMFSTSEVASSIKNTISPEIVKYEESIKKLIKFGLGKSLNDWISNFFDSFLGDNIFVENVLDPVINDPVKDYITDKILKVIKSGIVDQETFNSEIYATGSEVAAVYKDKLYGQKIRSLGDEMDKINIEIGIKKSALVKEICQGQQTAIERFRSIKYIGRFAEIREKARLSIEEERILLKGESLEFAKQCFKDWDKYLSAREVNIGLSNAKDIEQAFADYCTYNPDMAATWGFILIAEPDIQDEIEVKYAESIRIEGHIKPVHGQFYYFEKYGYSHDEVMKDIVVPSQKGVGFICRELY